MTDRCVGIQWNSTKSTGLEIARNLIGMLHRRGVMVCVDRTLAAALQDERLLVDAFGCCQLLIVLGGDGTILSGLDHAIRHDLPILGVNLGRLGFLTEMEIRDLDDAVIDRVLSGDYSLETRMTMTVDGQDDAEVFALNDIVITRSSPAVRVLSLEYRADGTIVDCISGDGLIVATATGSTAYSLSAGGPIILPGLDCFVLTPICPHTMNARPVVVSSEHCITVRVLDDRGGAQAVLDGRKTLPVENDIRQISIRKSKRQVKFIRLYERDHFGILRSKLSEWTH